MDLTTVSAAKAYLGITQSGQDAVIAALVTRESELIRKYCGRNFQPESFTNKRLDGTGGNRLMLPANPIVSVSSVQIYTTVIPPSPDGIAQPGYIYDDKMLYLLPGFYGGMNVFDYFPLGYQNVMVSWTSGYQTSETDFVPTSNTPTLSPSNGGTAISTVSVAYTANGTALTQVGNGPVAGQYSFTTGTFSFNSADANQQVTMTYGYVPAPVEQSCIEMVGLDLKQRDNLGVASKSLAGETVTYSSKGITDSVKEMLAPYRKVGYA